MMLWSQAWRLAKRELRGGLKGFRVFLACIVLGVGAIAGVGSLNHAIDGGLNRDARKLLGGDIDILLSSREIDAAQQDYLAQAARVSHVRELRAMADNTKGTRTLVELKAVDQLYPMAGTLEFTPSQDLHSALAQNNDGSFGALIEAPLQRKLGLAIGDLFRLGNITLSLSAVLNKEPDRIASVVNFGPRLMISDQALAASGLVVPGSVVRHHYRLELTTKRAAVDVAKDIEQAFPEAGWRVRTPDNAAPGVENFIERLALFLSFAGFATLLIGGLGVATAVKDFLDSKITTIATLKCLGAPSGLINRMYFIQIALLSLGAIALGLTIGMALPNLGALLLGDLLPVRPEVGIYLKPLGLAAGFGILTTLSFAIWPLGRAGAVPAQQLFRDVISPISAKPPKQFALIAGLCAVLLALLTVFSASNRLYGAIFVIGAAVSLAILAMAGKALVNSSRKIRHPKNTSWRLALASLHRPGTIAPNVVMSLGLGLSVLIAVSLIDSNLRQRLAEDIPDQAPAFFFIDIQSAQTEAFDQTLLAIKGVNKYKREASLRARIVKINGVDVDNAAVAPESQWAIRGDRALSYATQLPEGTRLTAGQWWPKDYQGPPLISLDAGLARGFKIGLGDSLTLNVLGRNVTAKIASLREIDWRSLRFDFAIIFSPGLLEKAPHSHIAALYVDPASEATVETKLGAEFPNVSIIRVREALESARAMMEGIGWAIRATASITLLAGLIVLAGAVASGRQRRLKEAVVLKVLGATRRRLLIAYLCEYGLLGALTGVIGAALGSLSAWGVTKFLLRLDFSLNPTVIALTLSICLIATLCAGFLGTWTALGRKAAPLLRNE